jgi:predicted anti-sigma-YlaC factor YlaD
MDCSEIRDAVSAGLDGETAPLPREVVQVHVRLCSACRDWSAAVAELQRGLRVGTAPVEIDRTDSILRAIDRRPGHQARSEHLALWRLVASLVALVQMAGAIPLLLGHGDEMHGHFARHLGVFAAALAVGLLMAAYRPDRARALLPILAVLVTGLVWSCLDDLVHGMPVPGSAIAHGADVIALLVVWQLAHLSDVTARRVHRRSPVLP